MSLTRRWVENLNFRPLAELVPHIVLDQAAILARVGQRGSADVEHAVDGPLHRVFPPEPLVLGEWQSRSYALQLGFASRLRDADARLLDNSNWFCKYFETNKQNEA